MVPLDEVFIIAEAGVNHNGNLDNAFKLIDLASRAGANAIKFQNYKTEELIQSGLTKETYQIEGDTNITIYVSEVCQQIKVVSENDSVILDYDPVSDEMNNISHDLLPKILVSNTGIGEKK